MFIIQAMITFSPSPIALPVGKKIRLVGGSSSMEGRVEIFHEGQWGMNAHILLCSFKKLCGVRIHKAYKILILKEECYLYTYVYPYTYL